MRLTMWIFLWLLMGPLFTNPVWGQIEESAEVFLEAYTDEFQEYFFEGLKQRGIENFDRSVEAFLKCKTLDPTSPVIDHELAKSYLLDNQLIQAETYAREALMGDLKNYWYLDTLVKAVLKQGFSLQRIKGMVPYENRDLRLNLADILYRNNRFEEALEVIEDLDKNTAMEVLKNKAMDSLQPPVSEAVVEEEAEVGEETTVLLEQLEAYYSNQEYKELEKIALENTERYPTQPVYYFYHGRALMGQSSFEKAVRSFETALDFIIDDWELRNEIYRDLARTYTAMGNSSKANMYLSKIKTGL